LYVFVSESKVVRVLPLRTAILKNAKGVQVKLRLGAHHIDYHEDHLFLFMSEIYLIDLG
jgi:hypothetical protein